MVIQPFKVGPDFIDPGLHEIAAGALSHNLDGWLMSRDVNKSLFQRAGTGKEIALVEGMMGLHDGFDGKSSRGSTAEMAHWLKLPIVLVIDANKLGRSIAAIVHGYRMFDPGIRIAAVVLNRVAGAGHFRMLADALEDTLILGWLPAEAAIEIPERHLGLLTAGEIAAQRIDVLGQFIDRHIDIGRFLDLLPTVNVASTDQKRDGQTLPGCRVAIAHDQAFSFYYHANRMELERAGAQVVEFSPLRDREIPEADLLYIGGGYPEIYLAELEANQSMRTSVRRHVEAGKRFYAECGGMMYLSRSIDKVPMVGVIPAEIEMTDRPVDFGYCEVRTLSSSILGPKGTAARGHQFHFSKASGASDTPLYQVRRGDTVTMEGFLFPNGAASYVHLHFLSNPSLAKHFVHF
jgi:cobyrinic acid a,c-diamide synthase